LVAKFEVFCESLATAICYEFALHAKEGNQVPLVLKVGASRRTIEPMLDSMGSWLKSERLPKVINAMQFLSSIWGDESFGITHAFACKLRTGRHGEAAFRILFEEVGCAGLIDSIEIDVERETLDGTTKFRIRPIAEINSLTAIRNAVIHEDASLPFTAEELAEKTSILRDTATEMTRAARSLVGASAPMLANVAAVTSG
jgi:hypothetical protein